MGAHPDIVRGLHDTDAAISRALDLSGPAATPLALQPPASFEAARQAREIATPITWWIGRMAGPDRLVEERMTWFWHDHFATSVAKVRAPYLMYQQHLTLRQHATGNFADLLRAVAKDPAMLLYLDGITNAATERNENFGRECLELFTLGRDGGYTQEDVVAASRAFTGWVIAVPGRPALEKLGAPWSSVFVPRRHDAGTKTLLGKTGTFDLDGALEVILDHRATGEFVVTKLYRELVGLSPDRATVTTLAKNFRRNYEIMPLVTAIVQHEAFTSDAAVRVKYRSPVEKLVGIVQASGGTGDTARLQAGRASGGVARALRTMSYLPFVPPNVGGFPKGARLTGPSNLVHSFDLVQAAAAPPRTRSVDDLFARFGIFDVSDTSRAVLARERDPGRRFVLAAASPEFTLT
ncbi:MAG: hypothetical protein QOF40_2485 [Actinomycetota bacterium]|nr:hypothetical protein [Actinomycetota bacterium]